MNKILKPYHKIHPNISPKIPTDKSNGALQPRVSGQYYYINNLASIYNIPTPNLSSPYVVSVISFGGGVYGNIDSVTGVMTNDSNSDIYNYWKSIGMTTFPTVIVKLINGAINNISDLNSTIENTIDIETIGGFCPSSNLIIVLYIGPNSFSQFSITLNYINTNPINFNGNNYKTNCISISWGAPEPYYGSYYLKQIDNVLSVLTSANINICVASGDNGSSDGLSGNNLDFPSSSPNCTSVGGTSLYCPPINNVYNYTNANRIESTWSNGGGGYSAYFSKPYYQSSINSTYRASPDIAMNADPNNGIYYIINNLTYIIGGTSCSAPMFAGFLAATNTKTFINPLLYSNNGCYNDIILGNNGGFRANNGYDNCTGLGSINGLLLKSIITSNIYIRLNQINPLNLNISNSFQATSSIQNIIWSSSNSSIASVNSSGLVVGISSGTVSIVATSISNPFIFNSFIVNVIQLTPTSITLTSSVPSLILYTTSPINTSKITAVVNPSNVSQSVIWSSSNNSIATVNSSGLVTALKTGTVIIIATSTVNNSISQSIQFNIYAHSLIVSPSVLRYSISKTTAPQLIRATVGNTENANIITWLSSNTNYCTFVNSVTSGNISIITVKCYKAGIGRTVTLTAKANNTIISTCIITIIA